MNVINKLIIRLNTAKTRALPMNDPASWTLQRGLGALDGIAITEIDNPIPKPKTAYIDVPGSNGELDATEMAGRLFYKNKTVKIKMQVLENEAPRYSFTALRDTFTAMQGRVVDFAFDLPTEVEWYYTGRLTVESVDEPSGELALEIDTYPFLQSAEKRWYDVPTKTSLDRAGRNWTAPYVPDGASFYENGGYISFYGNPGDTIEIYHSASSGKRYTIGVTYLLGGDFCFTGNGEKSRVLGVPVGDTLHMELTIDGSYYAWTKVNGTDVYKPCLRLAFILSELETDAAGNVLDTITLPTNVRIRPELANLDASNADVLLDGTRIHIPLEMPSGVFPDAVLPGVLADRSGTETVCYMTAVGNAANETPMVRIGFREEKLG